MKLSETEHGTRQSPNRVRDYAFELCRVHGWG